MFDYFCCLNHTRACSRSLYCAIQCVVVLPEVEWFETIFNIFQFFYIVEIVNNEMPNSFVVTLVFYHFLTTRLFQLFYPTKIDDMTTSQTDNTRGYYKLKNARTCKNYLYI